MMTTQTTGAKEAAQQRARMDFLMTLSRTQLYAYALYHEISFKQLQHEVEQEEKRRDQVQFLP